MKGAPVGGSDAISKKHQWSPRIWDCNSPVFVADKGIFAPLVTLFSLHPKSETLNPKQRGLFTGNLYLA